MRIAAIVPAYNEADRLSAVLDALRQTTLIDEVVVVNDGSADETYAVACRYEDVTPVNLPENIGKGGAMYAGAESTDADVVVFLDADLMGITGEQIDSIARPVVTQEMDVCIGVFSDGRGITDLAQKLTPYISGQRAMRRLTFLSIPGIDTVRSGVEVAMTKYLRSHGLRIGTVTLEGCTHTMKEEKLGWARGFSARMRMYYDIGRISLNSSHLMRRRHRLACSLRKLAKKRES